MQSPATRSTAPKYPSVVPLARSPALLLAIGLVHLVPLISVLPVGVPVWVRWLVVPLCLISAGHEYLAARRLREARLRPHAEGVQLILLGAMKEGRALPSSIEMGALVVLHWQAETDGKTQRFALLRDAFSAEEWRVLKVWLRWSVMKQGE